jgi:diguanylate cyclase (GGDEF)-like protein/PAS domain S-box-containing protein
MHASESLPSYIAMFISPTDLLPPRADRAHGLPSPVAQFPVATPGTALDLSITLDHEHVVLFVADGVECMMGYAAPIEVGQPLSQSCGDRDLIGAVRAGAGIPTRTMLVRTGLDGTERHVSIQVVPTGVQASNLVVLLSDATRQVRQEDDLLAARRVVDNISDGVVLVDAASRRVRQANAPALVMLDLDSEEVAGLCLERLCMRLRTEEGDTPTSAQLAMQAQARAYRCRRPDGSELPIEVRVDLLHLARRDVLAIVFRDISNRIQAAAELRAASSRCAITFSQAATGLAHVSLDGRWLKVNHKLAAILGYAEHELLSMSVSAATHPHDRDSDSFAWQRMLAGELSHATREKRYLRKDGSHAWVSVISSLACGEDGASSHFVCMVEDIGERKRADEKIRHLALHDALTGLPNRAGLHDYLERQLDAAFKAKRRLGVVFLDMDKLKKINDIHGHEEGDRALIQFARHLQQVVRSGDLVARLGGDEFVIVLGDVARRADIDATLHRTLSMQPESPLPGAPAGESRASCSIGVSIYPDDGRDAQTLIRHADLAMYRAKQRGGSRYEFFSSMPDLATPFPRMLTIPMEKQDD